MVCKNKTIAQKAIEVVENDILNFILKDGRKLILTGCMKLETGVFPDNYGGVTESQSGIAKIVAI